MKKSTRPRAVSQTAYARFVERISLVISEPCERLAMIVALDKYLEGDRVTYAAGLPDGCALAFEMLRFEIDLAIDRSARARERARKRKDEAEAASAPASKRSTQPKATVITTDENDGVTVETPAPVVLKSRRQRRAESRRPKTRWRGLGRVTV